ncbi:MAG: heme ABC exporter ATP-binding protein CcmA [Neisseriaceae bacterium]|nr:heme ABC exporter ATP-binding protein CcmA [Neisseriaceae bacterium]
MHPPHEEQASAGPWLKVQDLVLARQERVLNRPLSFWADAGDAIHIVGRNGCGKTTLLETLATLRPAYTGRVLWHGQMVKTWGDELRGLWHYCGHADALKREWTLGEHLAWQIRLSGQRPDPQTISSALTEMALTSALDVPIGQLSKGQQRRVALLRLRFLKRPVWLLDEPFSALDAQGAKSLVAWVDAHVRQAGLVIFTTHQDYPDLAQPPRQIVLAGGGA